MAKRMKLFKKSIALVVVMVTFLMLIGCMSIRGDFSVIAPKESDVMDIREYTISDEPAIDSYTRVSMFNIPWLGGLFGMDYERQNGPEVLAKKSLEKIPGAVGMIDAKYEYKYFQIPILFSVEKSKIESKKVLIKPILTSQLDQ